MAAGLFCTEAKGEKPSPPVVCFKIQSYCSAPSFSCEAYKELSLDV